MQGPCVEGQNLCNRGSFSLSCHASVYADVTYVVVIKVKVDTAESLWLFLPLGLFNNLKTSLNISIRGKFTFS